MDDYGESQNSQLSDKGIDMNDLSNMDYSDDEVE